MANDFLSSSTLFREVQHTNVVRFIGACTKPPQFCIITGEISSSICWLVETYKELLVQKMWPEYVQCKALHVHSTGLLEPQLSRIASYLLKIFLTLHINQCHYRF
jgi:hypothetical protein